MLKIAWVVCLTVLSRALLAQCYTQQIDPFNPKCIEPSYVNPAYYCIEPAFKPVCGCDGQTYRNICEANCRYGVIGVTTSGPCSGFEIDIFPNLVGGPNYLKFTLVQAAEVPATLVICDIYGKIVLYRNLPGMQRVELD